MHQTKKLYKRKIKSGIENNDIAIKKDINSNKNINVALKMLC